MAPSVTRQLSNPNRPSDPPQVRLWQMGRLLPPRLAAHLEAHSVLPVLYASSWFLTCFASDFPLPFAARIMDLVVTDCYAAPIMKVHGLCLLVFILGEEGADGPPWERGRRGSELTRSSLEVFL